MDDPVARRYLENGYLAHNPAWDLEDSPWKAEKAASMIRKYGISPETFCEVGCGAGGVLESLQREFPDAAFTGFDIAPDAEKFWDGPRESGIELHVGDFFLLNKKEYDLILLFDVLEHVADPHRFLAAMKPFAKHLLIHFPLDLSALSVLRESPLLHVRRKVGHIHYFTKELALELLEECSLTVIGWQYTEAAFSAPQRKFGTKLFGWLRRLVYLLHKDAGVRMLGGETLMVLAKPK